MKNISTHIAYKEATKSYTAEKYGIDNNPSNCTLERMRKVAESVFEPLREHFNVPMGIASFYRSKALNKLIGGVKRSEHVLGQAIDIDADIYGQITNKQIFEYIYNNLCFNQIIEEYPDESGEPKWVHVSYDYKGNNKQEALVAYKRRGKTKYKYYEA